MTRRLIIEFSVAKLIAISAVILNIIVYISRVPSKKDLKDLEIRLSSEMSDLRGEMSGLRRAFTDHLMYMHGGASKPAQTDR